jgi:hypothetical protein
VRNAVRKSLGKELIYNFMDVPYINFDDPVKSRETGDKGKGKDSNSRHANTDE